MTRCPSAENLELVLAILLARGAVEFSERRWRRTWRDYQIRCVARCGLLNLNGHLIFLSCRMWSGLAPELPCWPAGAFV